jgi:branched-chain amino acid transport system permease protein
VVGAGGALFAHFSYGFSANNFYLQRTFLVVAMLIIGGMGSLSGAVIGAVTVSVLTELLRQLEVGMAVGGLELDVPAGAGDVLLGIILLLVLILRPEGIVGDREIDWSFGGAAMRRLIRASTPTPVPGTGSESIDGELDRAAGRLEDGDTGDTAELS